MPFPKKKAYPGEEVTDGHFILISGASGQRRIFIEKKKMINIICELLKKILDVW